MDGRQERELKLYFPQPLVAKSLLSAVLLRPLDVRAIDKNICKDQKIINSV